jgi:hypothetical protein
MKYNAKIDWWIGASLLIAISLPVIFALNSSTAYAAIGPAAVLPLVFGFCYPQSYETTPEALVVRAGFTKRTIAYSQISAVRPSCDSRSALALSLDRVQIVYASGELLIAPRNQTAFFADIASRAPQLSRQGLGLAAPFTL